MPSFFTGVLGASSLFALLLFYLATSDIASNLSPQGCRMSWMSPSYVLQQGFDTQWSPLSQRYSLWLYREVGWDAVQETGFRTQSLPVLFIPGNAGSSHQVRSISSSATRQYYSSPYVVSQAFKTRGLKTLDFFAVEFNEDLSAFHGSTLDSQTAYTLQAISYILSQYPANTKVIVMGHSMGGIVATSLLPSNNISAIITMSTPHTLPPARFDSRIDRLYHKLQRTMDEDPTPILSICGGATDMMITSESCILPKTSKDNFRGTVFTSALEGAWTGVGHREMVWCHQVRWRVARAALELGGASDPPSRAHVLDKWLRDGHTLPPLEAKNGHDLNLSDSSGVDLLPSGQNVDLRQPRNSKTYLLPVLLGSTASDMQQLTVLVSQGSIDSVSPQNAISLRVNVFECTRASMSSAHCAFLKPETLKLIPNPIPGRSFPVPQEGADESEGVVLFEARVSTTKNTEFTNEFRWIAIKVEGAEGLGWVKAGLSSDTPVVSTSSTLSLLAGSTSTSIPPSEALSTTFTFPNLLSHALLVYRMIPHRSSTPACSEADLPPLVMHTSHAAETHYFPLLSGPNRRILLHTHLDAPFIDTTALGASSVTFKIYSSGEEACQKDISGFDLTIDWSATMGRWGPRYLNTLVSWAAGVALLVVFLGWSVEDRTSFMPSVGQSLEQYGQLLRRYLLPCSLVLAILPLPPSLYTGNKGVAFLSPIAPLTLLVASGLVCVIWWILLILSNGMGKASSLLLGSRHEKTSIQTGTMLSLLIICAVIFLFVPWQVAYLGCWLIHLHTCASAMELQKSVPGQRTAAVPLFQLNESAVSQGEVSPTLPSRRSSASAANPATIKRNNLDHNLHLLLLMTWLLPLTAPVLAVWVRTLVTAGFTTPFDGDHNFIAVLPFLVLVDFASWTPGKVFERPRFENTLSLRWLFAIGAAIAFLFGSHMPYLVLDVARVAVWIVVICRIGRRYWGGLPWSGSR